MRCEIIVADDSGKTKEIFEINTTFLDCGVIRRMVAEYISHSMSFAKEDGKHNFLISVNFKKEI